MTRWIGPALLGVVAALAGWYITMVAAPTVIMDQAWERLAAQTGFNRMVHTPLVTAERQTIVRPSPDLAYSICAFDLTRAPLRVRANPVPGHYWSLTVFDSATNVTFVESDRDSQGAPVDIVVATSDQTVPDALRKVVMPGTKGVALLRVLLNSRAEFDAVTRYRRQSFCRPLGAA